MKPLTLKTIEQVVGGRVIGADELEKERIFVSGVASDSRKIMQGDLFVPIRGERVDGHDFITACFEKGAICSFSEREILPPKGKYCILVKDAQKALLELAEYYLTLFDIPVIAITGSVGKTTTKDMIASVLMQKYCVLKTEGNYNTNIGLPLMVFRIGDEHEVAVLEMGMNSFGEIHNLSKVAKPNIAVITNIGVAHIEMLGSREGILKAKSEVFDYMTPQGVAILNGDNDMLQTLEGKVSQNIIWYGIENKRGIYAHSIYMEGLEKTRCTIHAPKGEIEVILPVAGVHMVQNALAATAVGLQMELSLEEIKKGIETFTMTKMRMAVEHTKKGITIINDVYNANPVSMKASLEVLAAASGRKVCILGDMGELGIYADQMHREVGEYAAQKGIDVIISIGELSRHLHQGAIKDGAKNAYHYDTQEEFWQEGLSMLASGDTVLVKGSRSRGLEQTVDKIQGVN